MFLPHFYLKIRLSTNFLELSGHIEFFPQTVWDYGNFISTFTFQEQDQETHKITKILMNKIPVTEIFEKKIGRLQRGVLPPGLPGLGVGFESPSRLRILPQNSLEFDPLELKNRNRFPLTGLRWTARYTGFFIFFFIFYNLPV